MITCTILISEQINGETAIAMNADQRDATKAETKVATVLDLGIRAAMTAILEKQGSPVGLLEGEGIEEFCRRFIQRETSKP